MIDNLAKAGEKEKIARDEESLKVSGKNIARQIKALVARDIYEPGAYYEVMIEDDKEVAKATEVLSDPKAYKKYLGK
jgi:carboxyl-terminal processing protease